MLVGMAEFYASKWLVPDSAWVVGPSRALTGQSLTGNETSAPGNSQPAHGPPDATKKHGERTTFTSKVIQAHCDDEQEETRPERRLSHPSSPSTSFFLLPWGPHPKPGQRSEELSRKLAHLLSLFTGKWTMKPLWQSLILHSHVCSTNGSGAEGWRLRSAKTLTR